MSQSFRPWSNHSRILLRASSCRWSPDWVHCSRNCRQSCVRELEEVMVGGLADRLGARHHRVGLDQVGRAVGLAAHLAGVAVLVLRVAVRALALDEPVGQEHLLDRVVELLDRPHLDQAARLELPVDVLGKLAGLFRVRGVVVVEVDVKPGEVAGVLVPDALDQRLRGDAFLLRPQHDGGAVGVVRAHVVALVPAHLLEAHPDVGLDVLHEMAEVDAAVGIGQRGGDEELALHRGARKPASLTKRMRTGLRDVRRSRASGAPAMSKDRGAGRDNSCFVSGSIHRARSR